MTAHEILDKAADEINTSCPKVSATYNKTREAVSLHVMRTDEYKTIIRAELPLDAPEQAAWHIALAARLAVYSVQLDGVVGVDAEGALVDEGTEQEGGEA